MALVSAVATLLAALFLCLGTGPDGERAHHPEGPAKATAFAAVTGEYTCPYDRGGCSLFPSLSPRCSARPCSTPAPRGGRAPRLAPPAGEGPARRSDARPRAPDLHVLQVLRT
ncbi:hypothetical protein O1L60_10865 [Streptomyces diastatochromogenes]|nr:hypothetical protein [Streptomyces diastatochromogenes]